MITEVPEEYSKSVVVDEGNTSGKPRPEPVRAKPNAVNDIIKTIIKTVTVLLSIFAVCILKDNMSPFRFNAPSRIALLSQIDELKQDLEAYEKLKKTYADDEAALSWDKQHISESEGHVKSMIDTSGEMSERFHDEEQRLMEENARSHEDIAEASKDGNIRARQDHEAVLQLSRDIQVSMIAAKKDREQNSELRQLIASTMAELKRHNIEVPSHIIQALEHGR
jgi:hypothetical protein